MPSPSPSAETKKIKDDSQAPNNSTKVNPVPQSLNMNVPASPPSRSGTKKKDDKPSTENVTSETCDGVVKECTGLKNVVACIKSSNGNSHCCSASWKAYVRNLLCCEL